MIFSGHFEMIISQYNFYFGWHGIAFYQKMLGLNSVYCLCQNYLSEMLSVIIFCNFGKAAWTLRKFFIAQKMLNIHKIYHSFQKIQNSKLKTSKLTENHKAPYQYICVTLYIPLDSFMMQNL